jgi:hypothetical protein
MEKKKSFKVEKDAEKLKKVAKARPSKKGAKNTFAEDGEPLDMDEDDGLYNHGFETFGREEEDDHQPS